MTRIWGDKLWFMARNYRRDGLSCEEIGEKIGLNAQQVLDKFLNERYTNNYKGRIPPKMTRRSAADDEAEGSVSPSEIERIQAPLKITPAALADRDRRSELRHQQNLTAAFFGDPPSGYSALDRKEKTRSEAQS